MYKLVIAEKHSVAQSLAKVIGATNKNEGYLEGKGQVFWQSEMSLRVGCNPIHENSSKNRGVSIQ